LSRDHVVNVSDGGLLTIAGGKWTTYRKMALDAVDQAIELGGLEAAASRTEERTLVGGAGYAPVLAGELQERFGLDHDVASHLAGAYGDRAHEVAELAESDELGARLAEGHPYLEAEVRYGARHEMARTSTDVLARRTRLGFLDRDAAVGAVPRVSELLAGELGWDDERATADRADAMAYLV
jgi:glycerol-3-phosphate dehydrogenase